jgi:hypothetical protein
MTLDELQEIGEALFGPHWRTEMRNVIGLSHRGFANWLEGKHPNPLPQYLEEVLEPVVAERINTLTEIQKTLTRRLKARE